MNRINQYTPVMPPVPDHYSRTDTGQAAAGTGFKEILQQKLAGGGLKISAHCQKRLEQNNIQLGQQQMDKLCIAVDKAADKGARESCVIMEDLVFIVSIANRTVKTVVDGQRVKDNVFTNIDSAVII